MTGIVRNLKDTYFWIMGGDGKVYFAAYPEVTDREERARIAPGTLIEFEPMNTHKEHEEAKSIRIKEESRC